MAAKLPDPFEWSHVDLLAYTKANPGGLLDMVELDYHCGTLRHRVKTGPLCAHLENLPACTLHFPRCCLEFPITAPILPQEGNNVFKWEKQEFDSVFAWLQAVKEHENSLPQRSDPKKLRFMAYSTFAFAMGAKVCMHVLYIFPCSPPPTLT